MISLQMLYGFVYARPLKRVHKKEYGEEYPDCYMFFEGKGPAPPSGHRVQLMYAPRD